MEFSKSYMQDNGVSVFIGSTDRDEIVFDLVGIDGGRRMGSNFSAFQNLTLEEARKLRKTLGKAIKAVEGEN
ncbi:hypothetical protein [Streptomyces sp. NPDC002644]